jgi:hypothetical protein
MPFPSLLSLAGRNWAIGSLMLFAIAQTPGVAAATPKRPPREPSGGIFFYAKDGFYDNTAPAANPHVLGVWIQFYWSQIEPEQGRFDWSRIDARMRPWLAAGKKVAMRVYWVGSGYWNDPAARTATPAWVWREGAKYVKHGPSGTEIPLCWDPVYQKYAARFMAEIARKFDDDPNVLFIDVTPGAETNPYRYVAFNQLTPEFKQQYAATPASDGRAYSDELWLATVRAHIDTADRIFRSLPVVITLNVASLNLREPHDYSVAIGDYAVQHGCYVGQNGLAGRSYSEARPADGSRQAAFARWTARGSRVVFETLGDANSQTRFGKVPLGTLREIIDAAKRGSAGYLLPYPRDVLKGTRGQPDYDPAYEEALAYGARILQR